MLTMKQQLKGMKEIVSIVYLTNTKQYRVTHCIAGAECVSMKTHLNPEEIKWAKTGKVECRQRVYLEV